jgi:hypothetical protein
MALDVNGTRLFQYADEVSLLSKQGRPGVG